MMQVLPARFWTVIGWLGIALVAIAIPYAMADPVMGVVVLFAAIVVGGTSGIGVNANARFGITIILLSTVITNVMAHYTHAAGFNAPDLSVVRETIAVLALPIPVSAVLLAAGEIRRRMRHPR